MVYTKTGDKGSTSLVGGTRVSKGHQRVEAYGTVDELNSHIGLMAAMIDRLDTSLYSQLKAIQNQLFTIQTLLATEDEKTYQTLPHLSPDDPTTLEQWIDAMDCQLPKLKAFVIPGGSIASTQCHVARTVCRRAEREIVRLSEESPVEAIIHQFINRLSDYLFVASRYILLLEQKEENFWSCK